MRTASYLLPLFASLLLTSSIAMAEFKVAVVDVGRVLNESSEAQQKRKDLDKKSLEYKGKLEEKRSALKSMEEKLKETKASESSKEADQFRSSVKDYERTVKDAEDDMRKEFMKVNKGLAERAVKTITDYAKRNQLDLVIDKSDKPQGPVLYGAPSFDITDAVIKDMNK